MSSHQGTRGDLTELQISSTCRGRPRQTDHREAVREPGFNIPEWNEGRAEVIWWDLTFDGKRRLEDEVRSLTRLRRADRGGG